MGPEFQFTKVQVQTLQSLDSSFIVLHCCAGAGKTTILVCLCLWVLKVHAEGYRACVHCMAESQETVLDFLSLVREIHGSTLNIGPLGFDAESWTDRLKVDLRNKVLLSGISIITVINNLEQCLGFTCSRAQYLKTSRVTELLAFLRIVKCLCTVHHVLLHRYYYTKLREKQASMLMNLCVVGSTVSYVRKLVGRRSPWSKTFRNFNNVLALVDEVQSLGHLEVSGLCSVFKNCIAVGDENQDCSDLLHSPHASASTPVLQSAAMLRQRNVIGWARRNPSVSVYCNQETLRYGQPLLQHLQKLFPFTSTFRKWKLPLHTFMYTHICARIMDPN